MLVLCAERLSVTLLGQKDVAEHLAAADDRSAEKGVHRWMTRRETVAAGVLGQVDETKRLLAIDEDPEDATSRRVGAGRLMFLLGHARRDEPRDPAVRTEDPEGAIPCSGDGARGLDDRRERLLDVETLSDREARGREHVETHRRRRPSALGGGILGECHGDLFPAGDGGCGARACDSVASSTTCHLARRPSRGRVPASTASDRRRWWFPSDGFHVGWGGGPLAGSATACGHR